MMTKERSGKLAGLKLLFALPLILLIFIGFSCTSEKNEILEPVKEIKEVADAGTLNTAEPVGELKSIAEDKEIFTVVEVMPTFMGGDINKFREWVSRNVKYPAEAAKEGIQGQVFVMFVVDENGKVSGSEILRGVDPSLDAEALRVVNMSPDWTPGTQRGKDVKVKFSITVNYKLQ